MTLELSDKGLRTHEAWSAASYTLPRYDRAAMVRETRNHPVWLHFGPGNIFKAFQANAAQALLDRGLMRTGVIVVERAPDAEKRRFYEDHDNLHVLVTLKADGSVEKRVIGSVAEVRYLLSEDEAERARLREIITAPSLQLVSFTITEKGYSLLGAKGETREEIARDFAAGPERAKSYAGRIAALLCARAASDGAPLALVSMDNCARNGDRLRETVTAFADAWTAAGLAPASFGTWLRERVSFPWTMIDKITPGPDESVAALLREDGLGGMDAAVTSRGTHVAPFVNAEESEYLVVEDDFPNGRPPLEQAGILFTDRATVERVERMKVSTCLNPLHTALALAGCLLGYERISEEMKDPALRALARGIGYREGLPAVTDPGILRPKDFLDTVVNVRLPNPFLPDTPQRIASDTSQKLPVRFGETVKAYLASDTLDIGDLRLIPFVFALWLRYLMAVDDRGEAFTPSPDPLLEEARAAVAPFRLGTVPDAEETRAALHGLLTNEAVFDVDLARAGLEDRVIDNFRAMLAGPGAVRAALEAAVES